MNVKYQKTYQVKYEMSDTPVNRAHANFEDALRDCKTCQAAARAGGDLQKIGIVAYLNCDPVALTDDQWSRI